MSVSECHVFQLGGAASAAAAGGAVAAELDCMLVRESVRPRLAPRAHVRRGRSSRLEGAPRVCGPALPHFMPTRAVRNARRTQARREEGGQLLVNFFVQQEEGPTRHRWIRARRESKCNNKA